ncbi:MAG: hypothetical protein QME49_04335 [bacterium]|nr:hypothetical protein [bacterium]
MRYNIMSLIIIIIVTIALIIIASVSILEASVLSVGHQEIFATLEDQVFTPPKEMSTITITVKPYKIEMEIKKEEKVSIELKNSMDIELDIDVCVIQMQQALDGTPVMEEDGGNWIGSQVIHVKPIEFALLSNQSRQVEVTILRSDKVTQGIYAGICFKAYPCGEPDFKPAKYWTFVMLSFPEIQHKDGEIKDIRLKQDSPGENIKIFSIFHNTGDVYFSPKGKLFIKNLTGSQIAEIPIGSGIVLPGFSRQTV